MKHKKKVGTNKLNTFTCLEDYDHYLGLDYSQEGYSLGRVTAKMMTPKIISGSRQVEEIQSELKKLKGKKHT